MRLRSRFPILLALASAALLALASPALGATFTVTNTNDEGAGSLRQAITESNAAGPGNTIAFAIPGPGPFTIVPTSALPTLTNGTTIDGCTQPGADCGALPLTLEIRLDGQALAVADQVTIEGISFTGPGTAIAAQRVAEEGNFWISRNLTVAHDYIGLAPDGSAAGKTITFALEPQNRNNELKNLHILHNVIGSNTGAAIDAVTTCAFTACKAMPGARIEGNIIGLDPTGTLPRPNGAGIVLEQTSDTWVVGNTIVGNKGAGIVHSGRSQATPHSPPATDPGLLIEGNLIEGNANEGIALGPDTTGLNANGKDPYSGPIQVYGNAIRGNGTGGTFPGIAVTAAAETLRPNLQIGGLAPGQANTISGNSGAGVAIGAGTADTSVAVTVRGNSIFGNGGPRIDLASDGPTANGPAGSPRTGPDALLNFPVIETLAHGSLIVDGTYGGAPSARFTLDFYKSETEAGPQVWVGSTEVETDAAGVAPFHAEFEPDVPAGWFIDATATDAQGDTSEFGQSMIVPEPQSDLAIAGTGPSAAKPGEQVAYLLKAENRGPNTESSVTVTDTLPAGLAYVSDDGGCDASALPALHCEVGVLANGESRTIEVVAEVLATSGTIENTAAVGGANPDPELADNSSTATTAISPLVADLALTKTASSAGVAGPGDSITYTLVASDNGPDPSPGTVVLDTLPAGLAYVSDDAGCDTSALPQIRCDLGALASGGSQSFHIVTKVNSIDGRPITNQASVSGAYPDSDPANNAAAAQTQVAPRPSTPPASIPGSPTKSAAPPARPKPPRHHKHKRKHKHTQPGMPKLVLKMVANTGFARPSSVVGYTITVRNDGDAAARRVTVCDEPPAQQRTLRTEPAVRNKSAPCWHLDRLVRGKKRVLRLNAEVEMTSGAAVQRNRASVRAANVKRVRTARAAVRVKPLPETACGSELTRPAFGPPRIELRC